MLGVRFKSVFAFFMNKKKLMLCRLKKVEKELKDWKMEKKREWKE